VLDLAKIEAGKLELEAAPFDLEDLGRRVCDTFAELAAAKALALTVKIDAPLAGLWVGDAMRIRQVLANLVSNAVKFTAAGSVTLAIQPAAGGIRLTVTDTGIGLTEAQIAGMFDKFSQADASTTRRYGGTGLGLSICRNLVEMMGGAITAQSVFGHGAAFTVDLPLRRAAPEEETGPAESAAKPVPTAGRLRVLAAEDNPTNQLVLRALMAPLDAELTVVGNGREAVEAFAERAFDVVLMDIQMPEMNGLNATRAIRDFEAALDRPRTPILALTANVMSNQVEAYLAAGMDDYVAKPLEAAALFAALEAVVADLEKREAA